MKNLDESFKFNKFKMKQHNVEKCLNFLVYLGLYFCYMQSKHSNIILSESLEQALNSGLCCNLFPLSRKMF